MQVEAYGKTYPCSRAVKGRDYIHLFKGGEQIASIQGIKDFTPYSLVDGNGMTLAFDAPEPDAITRLQLAIVELYEEVLGK